MNEQLISSQKEKMDFIRKFPEKELSINGWSEKEAELAVQIFDTLDLFIKNGNYLELGCGSGILCKFLFLFSKKKITPYGVDVNLEAIRIAKNNNSQFADNFINDNYFDFLKSNSSVLKKFSTISIFVSGEENWKNLLKILKPIIKRYPKINFLICDYDDNLINTKKEKIIKFISEIKKVSPLSIVHNSLLIIGQDKKIHKVANDLREHILNDPDYKEEEDYTKEFINGFIAEKNSSSFYLIKENKAKSKIKFFLNNNIRFSTIKFIKGATVVEKNISREKIKKGDRVMVMANKDKERTVFAIKKYLE